MRFSEILSRRHLPALDGLRALAVGTVIVYHAGVSGVPGDLGVTAFFVLSGFLITWLLLREQDRHGRIDLKAFYIRRSLRIFPAYFALVFFSLGVDFVLGDAWTPGRVWTALTYTLNYHNAFFGHEGPIAHGWSLAVEEQFYLVWPAAFLLWGTVSRQKRGLIAVIALVLFWRAALLRAGAPDHYLYNAFDTRMDSLAIGCLLALLCRSPRFLASVDRVGARAWQPLPVLAALLVSRMALPDAYHYSLGFTIDSLLVAILIVQLVQLSTVRAWAWLEYRFVRWMGVLSYPLYLWHIWALDVGRNMPGGRVVQVVSGIVFSFVLAAGSYYCLERYFLRMKESFAAGRSRPAQTPAGSTGAASTTAGARPNVVL